MRKLVMALVLVLALALPSLAAEVILSDFTPEESFRTLAANGAVLESFEITSETAISGDTSAKIVFDLTDPEQNWSEVNVIVDFPDTIDVEGVSEVRLWVHNDGIPHDLMILFYDGFVEGSVWHIVDWDGWEHLVIDVSETEAQWNMEHVRFDRLERVRIVVGDGAGSNKSKGTIFIDRLAVLIAGDEDDEVQGPDQQSGLPVKEETEATEIADLNMAHTNYVTVTPTEDTSSIIKNPAMGWVLYFEHSEPIINPIAYWSRVDPYIDAASIFYMRIPWSLMEPAEGQYAWEHNAGYKRLVDMALERGLKLAFRVIVDSQDMRMQATPEFVFNAGAQGYPTQSNPNYTTPILNDPVFRAKFETFIAAFAEQYDDPAMVDFVDAQGLGWWGEMHNIQHLTGLDMDDTFQWITELYSSNFQNVLLGGQYGNAFDPALQNWAIREKGYMIRRDSYGSPVWFPQKEKDLIKSFWPEVPVFAENCYQSFVSWPGSCDGHTRPIEDMLTRVVNDALETHANTLDLRHPEDVIEWVTNHPELVQRFATEGGYRFVLNEVSFPGEMIAGESYLVSHSWKNTAVGKLPNDMPNWGHKYKVAFALLDPETEEPVYMSLADAEPADWIAGEDFVYTTVLTEVDVPAGPYVFAVAIVDSQAGNEPAIKLAVKDMETSAGWYRLGEVVFHSR